VKNAIRLFLPGRKNYLFSKNTGRAGASKKLNSLMEKAEVNNIEP